MSGRKQHFIPQSLLRGFTAPEGKSRQPQVWVFPKSGAPFKTATHGIAAQRHFYSEPSVNGSETLDDVITRYEGELGETLRVLRSGDERPVDRQTAEELIAHLTLRNAHLRSSLRHAFGGIVDGALGILSNVDNAMSMLGLNSSRPGPIFRDALAKNIETVRSQLPQGLPDDLIEYLAFVYAKENFRETFRTGIGPLTIGLRRSFEAMSGEFRRGHNSILSKLLFPTGLLKTVPVTSWEVVDVEFDLILPDCVAVAADARGEPSPVLFGDLTTSRVVAIPLCSRRLLVGVTEETPTDWLSQFNHWAAACSHQFFISATETPIADGLSDLIGMRSMITIDGMIQRTLSEVKVERDERDRGDSAIELRTDGRGVPGSLAGYQVTLLDFGDAEFAGRLSDEIAGIVADLNQVIPLRRLDGFTFAVDYPKALAGLDRGFSTSSQLTTVAAEYGEGVFQTPIVVRDGVLKGRVVAREYLATGLLSETENDRSLPLYFLVNALTRISFVDLVDETIPGFWLGRYRDHYRASQRVASINALESYYSARLAVAFQPDIARTQEELVASTLAAFAVKAETAIKDHWRSSNFEMLADTALEGAEHVLARVCELLGSLHGLDKSSAEAIAIAPQLANCGLSGWFGALEDDLRRWWATVGDVDDPSSLFCLEHHVDRLCWAASILLWKYDDGSPAVYAPLPPVDFVSP